MEKTTGSGSKVTQAVLVRPARKILSRLPIAFFFPGTWDFTGLNSLLERKQTENRLPVHTALFDTNTRGGTDV